MAKQFVKHHHSAHHASVGGGKEPHVTKLEREDVVKPGHEMRSHIRGSRQHANKRHGSRKHINRK